MNTVIIVPQPQKECMLIEGKRFCREEDLSRHDVGATLLLSGVVAAYYIFVPILLDRMGLPDIVIFASFVAPLVVVGLWMILL